MKAVIQLFVSAVLTFTFIVAFQFSASATTDPQTLSDDCPECNPAGQQHILFGGYYSVKEFRASLVLNNKGPQPLPVAVAAYAVDGDRIESGDIELRGNEVRVLDLNQVFASYPNKFREGNLELTYQYDGCSLVLSAGIILKDIHARIAFDHLLFRTAEFTGTALEAVWWVPSPASKMQLVLTSRADERTTASITVWSLGLPPNKKAIDILLDPRETRVVDVPKAFTIGSLGQDKWASGAISIEHSGKPGQVVARGLVEDRQLRYSNSIEFKDPGAGASRSLHGAGLRLGNVGGQQMFPIVVVRNVDDSPSELTVSMPYTDRQGQARTLELDDMTLGPYEVRDLSGEIAARVSEIDGEAATVGFELSYSTDPGSVVALVHTVSADGDLVFRVPLVDPDTKGSAGIYPWRIEGRDSTYLYLKNATRVVQEYTVELDFEGGAYVLGLKKLEPGQTFVLDVANLRDNQVPDEAGKVIPLDATSGQIHWSVIGTDNHSMIGRSEQVDPENGISTNFSCFVCCPNSFNNA